MKHIIIKFGLLAGLLLILLELGRYSLTTNDYFKEFLLVISATTLVLFGMLLRNYISSRKSLLKSEKVVNEEKLALLNISKREYEVLVNVAEGRSNNEIANMLFVSENTVKTHISNLYSKLNVKRRTEAIKQAKEYGII